MLVRILKVLWQGNYVWILSYLESKAAQIAGCDRFRLGADITYNIIDHLNRSIKIQVEGSKLQLPEILSKGQTLVLEQIYCPESKIHRHSIIAVSGFLSENSD
jgi:hypothetical protein